MRVFRSPAPSPTCFFCRTTLSRPPRNPESFKCPHCLCWNRYDKAGQIVSDEPAMRDESLNTFSFAKRASPSKHRLPTTYGKGPFCHTCETNQTLLINLLSNYLPSPEDPSYEARVAEMPAYTTSLQARYPPVCKDCQPTVDEELRKKEHMARTTALGGWLKQSQHIGTQRSTERKRGGQEILMWKVRGALWVTTLALFVSVDLVGVLRYNMLNGRPSLVLPVFALLSLLWAFWDPTWLSVRDSRLQGRAFRVSGRERYIRCQMIIWVSRLAMSSVIALRSLSVLPDRIMPNHLQSLHATALAVEVVLFIFSLGKLRIRQPPTVRLMEPRALRNEASRESSTTIPGPEPLLSGLSSSAHPPSSSTNPIFGQPSFPTPTSIDVPDEDMMDWTPIHPQGAIPDRVQDREGWMRPQRFFPPEQPTGLEDLFEMAKLDVEEHTEIQSRQPQEQREDGGDEMRELGLFFGAAVLVVLVAGLGVYRF